METRYDENLFAYQRKKHFKHLRKLMGKIFAPLIKAFKTVEEDFSDRSEIRKALIFMLKLRVPILIIIVLAVTAAAGYFIVQSDNVATTEMSLNYEESANGLNPNSTRFNVYDFASQEVVEKMLSYCGIDKDAVDVNEIMSCISIRPTNTKAFSEDNYFISTSYKITLKKPQSIRDVGTRDILNLLCKAYKDNLYSKYTENRSILDFDIDKFNDVEFMEIADLLDLKAQQIEKYLNTRAKQNKTFTEEESNETFKSLAQKVEDLRTYDIDKYRTFVIQAGPSFNKARYTRALSYVNLINGLSYDKDMAAYDVRNDGIKMYRENMINIVMIPSIDESKKTYYMSKTKTGMDYMASQADDYLLTAQETAKSIATNEDLIAKMQAGTNDAADIKKANDMIGEIRLKFSELSKQIETIDKEFIKYKTKDYLTFKRSTQAFRQRIRLDTLMALAVVMLLGMFAAIWLRFRYFGGGNKSEGISAFTLPVQR